MRAYLIRRTLVAAITLVGITIVVFVMMHLIPGSPIDSELDSGLSLPVPAADLEAIRKLYGLDRPLHAQYLDWLRRVATLDFGTSLRDHRPVIEKIWEAARVTMTLQSIALVAIFLIGVPIGVACAARHRRPFDRIASATLLGIYSLPTFWVATLALVFLGGRFFPAFGLSSDDSGRLSAGAWILDRAWHLALPVLCLTLVGVAIVSRYARAGVLEALRADFIRTAQAKGLERRRVLFHHALRNGLLPLLTLVGAILPALIGGSLVIEQIFGIHGMGSLAFEAARSLDYPVVLGVTTMTGAFTLAGFLLSDLLYAAADPRIRLR